MDTETLLHIVYECNVTRNIWILLQKWLENRNIFMSISKQAIILNISNNGQGIDTIILASKWYLYSCRCNMCYQTL